MMNTENKHLHQTKICRKIQHHLSINGTQVCITSRLESKRAILGTRRGLERLKLKARPKLVMNKSEKLLKVPEA